jgi:thymidine kinase
MMMKKNFKKMKQTLWQNGVGGHPVHDRAGYLELIVGPMFSGKTSELQRRLRLAQIAGYGVKAFKYVHDVRYGEKMSTHDSIGYEAYAFNNIENIFSQLNGEQIVGVDEIQFALLPEKFDDKFSYEKICESALDKIKTKVQTGTHFICAGLPTNFRGEPFNYFMHLLLGHADMVSSFTAICTYKENGMQCSRPATRTQRIINGQPAHYDDPLTLIGAQDSYEARCPAHHFVPRGESRTLFN